MEKLFVKKFNSKHFSYGSFDTYEKQICDFIMKNDEIDDVSEFLRRFPVDYRCSIKDIDAKDLVGYAALYDYKGSMKTANLRIETDQTLSSDEVKEVIDALSSFWKDKLDIEYFDSITYLSADDYSVKFKDTLTAKSILESPYLTPLEDDKTNIYYHFAYPVAVKKDGTILAIFGLSELSWPNKSAFLNIILSNENAKADNLPFISEALNDYLDYLHECKIHNITYGVSSLDDYKLSIAQNSNLNLFASMPYASLYKKHLNTLHLFEHLEDGDKRFIALNDMPPIKQDAFFARFMLAKTIPLKWGYTLVSPHLLNDKQKEDVLVNFAKACEDKEHFTAPLGIDKFFVTSSLLARKIPEIAYILFSKDEKPCGFINLIKEIGHGTNAHIEIGVFPPYQKMGLGSVMLDAFTDEVFRCNMASLTSCVYNFNEPSNYLHQKWGELLGTRNEAYFNDGKFYDIHYYHKINPSLIRKRQ